MNEAVIEWSVGMSSTIFVPLIIFFICLMVVFLKIRGIGTLPFSIIIMVFTFLCVAQLIDFSYSKHVKIARENKEIAVAFQPKQVVDGNTNVFIVEEKRFTPARAKKVVYKKDSEDKPYIVVDKITFEGEPVWYTSEDSVERLNSTTKYLLKEVHY